MKITGTRSYIIVELFGRRLKILGELTSTPAFYAEKNSIRRWEAPYDNEFITESEKETIIEQILQNDNKEFEIFFV